MKVLFVFWILLIFGALMMETEAQCYCTADYTPVCGADGRTYSNVCRLNCAGVPLVHRGPCRYYYG